MRETLFKKGTTIFYYAEQPIGSGHNVLVAKNARLYSRNFSGERSKFGTKNLCVDIPEEIKDRLLSDGWNVVVKVPDDPRYDPRYFLPVTIRFNNRGPEITKIAPGTPVTYDEDIVGNLDSTDMADIELSINPSPKKDGSGVSAYLRKMRFKLNRDPLDYFDEEDEDEEIPNF